MKVLVTGGAGFVGTNLIKSLLEKDFEITSIDNYTTGLKLNHIDGCNYIEGDIRNILDYSKWGKFDTVYHMAALARIQPSFKNPTEYFSVNGNGTLNVVNFCAKNKIPLIYAGSSSKHNGKFKNPYTFSKDIGEDIIKLYQEHFSLQASITRFYNVYGPYQLLEGSHTTLIGRWINNIENGRKCIVYGDGEQRRDFTHIDDIVEALVKIPEKKAWGLEFELGRGRNFSVNEIAEMFGIIPQYESGKKGEARNTLCLSLTARNILEWIPEKNINEYIEEWKLTRKVTK